ncbi:MAG: hypothetical protein ABEI97_00170 [Candidatus Nanohaloarchaea archaeon]
MSDCEAVDCSLNIVQFPNGDFIHEDFTIYDENDANADGAMFWQKNPGGGPSNGYAMTSRKGWHFFIDSNDDSTANGNQFSIGQDANTEGGTNYQENFRVEQGGNVEILNGKIPVDEHVDVDRPEDAHEIVNFGVIETLFREILPRECEKNNNALWLSTVILHEIARSQAFENGNKRTAYLASSLFLIKCQAMHGREKAHFLILGEEFTNKIAAAAVGNISRKDLYDYLDERAAELD